MEISEELQSSKGEVEPEPLLVLPTSSPLPPEISEPSEPPPVYCSNCCEILTVGEGPEAARKAVYELLQGPELIKISTVLERVLKLSHLKEAFLEEALHENTPLCPSCANILGHLNVLYTEFLRVQTFESYLSKKIERLDEIIRRNVAVVEVQPDIEFETANSPESDPETKVENGTKIDVIQLEIQNEDLEKPEPKVLIKKEEPALDENIKNGPWVIVKRLRPRDIEVERERLRDCTPDCEDQSDEGLSDDDEWEKPKKRKYTKRNKIKRAKKEFTSKRSRKVKEGASATLLSPKKTKKKSRRGGFYETFFKRKMVHPFPCVYCTTDFDLESDRAEHLRATHCEMKPIICSPCGKVFGSEAEKEKHSPKCGWVPPNFHPPPYICEKCGKEFETWLSLSGHVRQVCSDRRFFCDQCNFIAKTNGVLLAHKRSVHEVVTERVPCEECSKSFKSEKHLKWHFKHMHTLEGREKYQGYQQKAREKIKQMNKERQAKLTPFCEQCNIDFQTVHRFINHYNAVHETKKWQCEQCGKSFAKAKVFRKHVRITHSDARPFVCDQCGNSFKSMTNLQTHLYRVHTEEGRLKNNEYYRESRRKRQKVVEALTKAGVIVPANNQKQPPPSQPPPPPPPAQDTPWDASFLNRPGENNNSFIQQF